MNAFAKKKYMTLDSYEKAFIREANNEETIDCAGYRVESGDSKGFLL